jgi:hypothetical protein
MLVFKQKKHGKSGINKLHYTKGEIPFKYYQGKYLNGVIKKATHVLSNVFTTD